MIMCPLYLFRVVETAGHTLHLANGSGRTVLPHTLSSLAVFRRLTHHSTPFRFLSYAAHLSAK